MIALNTFQQKEELTENADKFSYRKKIDFPLVFLTSELLQLFHLPHFPDQ